MTSFGATLAICLYLGWGIATSPLPIAGLLVMLLSKRAQLTAWVFTVTWFGCQLVAIALFTMAAHTLAGLHISSSEKHDIAVATLLVAVAMVCAGLTLVVRQRRHPSGRSGEHTRAFLATAAEAGPKQAVGMAFFTAALNVTNVPYWAAIGLMIERARVGTGDRALLVLCAALAASATFILITALVLVLGRRLERPLEWGRNTLEKHSGAVVPSFLIISGSFMGVLAALDLGWI